MVWASFAVTVFTAEAADVPSGASRSHRWGGPLRLALLYGLRRSELLALRWDDGEAEAGKVRSDNAVAIGEPRDEITVLER